MDIGAFSYRLKIAVEPQWAEIIKQVVGLRDHYEQKEFAKKLTDLPDDRMLHRHYDFTEFFDSQTGLTTRFQRLHTNGKTHSGFVKEFADAGYLFGHNSPLVPEGQERKHQIAVTEHGISMECFEPHTGQLDTVYGRPSLFAFPIDAVVEFGVALQLRFSDLSTSHVIKWPHDIDGALQKKGTKYEDMWTYTPTEFNLEREDREFFLHYGKPKVAKTASWLTPYFMHPCCYFCIELEVFTPQSARHSARLANSHFGSKSLLD
jgi:hypothetical protein